MILKLVLKNEKARHQVKGTVGRLTFQAEGLEHTVTEIGKNTSRALASKEKVKFNENEEIGRWSL